jgi:UDP-N-acetylmuramoyl-tripeptide--D-alanyl-D-alanine ligase
VLNADDARVASFAQTHSGPVVLYGQSPAANIRGEDVIFVPEGARFRVGNVNFETALTGRHNVSNILAGIAVASVHGMRTEQLTERVKSLAPGKMRGQRLLHQGIVVYNDCYNSNPGAARAMLDVLRDTPARRRIAVLGEMLELGEFSESLHREVGAHAADCGIDVLIAVQGEALQLLRGASDRGLREEQLSFVDNARDAGNLARVLAEPGDAILFKGSRGVQLEHALEQFLAPAQNGFITGSEGGN